MCVARCGGGAGCSSRSCDSWTWKHFGWLYFSPGGSHTVRQGQADSRRRGQTGPQKKTWACLRRMLTQGQSDPCATAYAFGPTCSSTTYLTPCHNVQADPYMYAYMRSSARQHAARYQPCSTVDSHTTCVQAAPADPQCGIISQLSTALWVFTVVAFCAAWNGGGVL